MFVRFKRDTQIGATVHLAGNVHDADEATCLLLIATGQAEEADPPTRAGVSPRHLNESRDQHERVKEAEAIESGLMPTAKAMRATAPRQNTRRDPDTVIAVEPGGDPAKVTDAESKAAADATVKGPPDAKGLRPEPANVGIVTQPAVSGASPPVTGTAVGNDSPAGAPKGTVTDGNKGKSR